MNEDTNVRVLLNDGHNVPMFQVFRDMAHLTQIHHLNEEQVEELEEYGETTNDNGEILTVFGPGQQIYTQDYTKDVLDLG